MYKKRLFYYILIAIITLSVTGCRSTEVRQIQQVSSANSYERYISDSEEARMAIINDGIEKRSAYYNKKINKIEKRIEKKYEILAVNLGTMDRQTALSIENACKYMFQTYPILKGHITNLTLSNDWDEEDSIAKYEKHTFIQNNLETGIYPFVIKRQIVLSEEFLNPVRLNNIIKKSVLDGHWMKDTNIEALLVHEMSHALMDAIICQKYELLDTVYISRENADAFSKCMTDNLAANQSTEIEICNAAYKKYKKNYKSEESYEEFCAQISDYAIGLQEDGGYSYAETCAEACVDVYLHGESSSVAARLIVEELSGFCMSGKE